MRWEWIYWIPEQAKWRCDVMRCDAMLLLDARVWLLCCAVFGTEGGQSEKEAHTHRHTHSGLIDCHTPVSCIVLVCVCVGWCLASSELFTNSNRRAFERERSTGTKTAQTALGPLFFLTDQQRFRKIPKATLPTNQHTAQLPYSLQPNSRERKEAFFFFLNFGILRVAAHDECVLLTQLRGYVAGEFVYPPHL